LAFCLNFGKKLKKVIKKVAPKVVAPIAINFIPGIGPIAGAALTAAAGKASGLSTKQALLGGALSFAGGKLFQMSNGLEATLRLVRQEKLPQQVVIFLAEQVNF
jgi:hypothetical protein